MIYIVYNIFRFSGLNMTFENNPLRNKFWSIVENKYVSSIVSYLKSICNYANLDYISAFRTVAKDGEFPFEELEDFVRSKKYASVVTLNIKWAMVVNNIMVFTILTLVNSSLRLETSSQSNV